MGRLLNVHWMVGLSQLICFTVPIKGAEQDSKISCFLLTLAFALLRSRYLQHLRFALTYCLPLLTMAHIKHTAHMSNDEAHPKGVDVVTHEVVEVLSVPNKDSLEVVDSQSCEGSEAHAYDSDEERGSQPYTKGKCYRSCCRCGRYIRVRSLHYWKGMDPSNGGSCLFRQMQWQGSRCRNGAAHPNSRNQNWVTVCMLRIKFSHTEDNNVIKE
jgi:hypothetical protein